MAEEIVIDAQLRQESGKNENRRLRSSGMIPAILYGVTNENISLSVKPLDVVKILRSKKGANTLFHINMIGERTTRSAVLIKDYQLDPVKDILIHCDFVRVNMDEKLETMVPIHTTGKAKGVELGGMLEMVMREVPVECFPSDIPENVVIDVSEMVIGDSLRVRDLNLGDKITVLAEEDLLVLHCVPPKKIVEEVAEVAAEEGEAVEGAEGEGEAKAKAESEEEKEK
jgi:large subunit ribosomal protein L25